MNLKYRPEIDGLRAVAVLPVILFHAGFSTFSGGFVGVDMFFVISGYLITSIIVKDFEAGTFSFWDFYERRARRILPALFLVMLCCIPFAWMLMPPIELRAFSASVVSVSLFASNFLFWRQSGYFDGASELKPLLHTWSLSVEEQFYIFFPIAILLLWRLGRRNVIGAIALVAVLSLALSQYASSHYPSANFYLLPTRAWELLAGALCSFIVAKPNLPRDNILSAAGLVAITMSVFIYDETIPFPSLYTLLPVLGTCAVLQFARQGTLVVSLLSLKPVVGVGLISYSAYLWHQPLFAFARLGSLTEPTWQLMLFLTVASIGLAYLSWHFVEVPARIRGAWPLPNRRTVFTSLGAMGVLFMTAGIAGYITKGIPSRFGSLNLPEPWKEIRCHGAEAIKNFDNPLEECLGSGRSHKGRNIYLVGDSHAAQLTFPLKVLSDRRDENLYFINTESSSDFPQSFLREAIVRSDRLFDHILRTAESGDVLFLAFHRGHLNDLRDKHIPLDQHITENNKMQNFITHMEYYTPKLARVGLNIFLVEDTPLLPSQTAIGWCKILDRKCLVSRNQDEHTRERQELIFETLARSYPDNITVIDPLPILYNGKAFFNPIYGDGDYKMFDQHHLTERAALDLLPLFEDLLKKK